MFRKYKQKAKQESYMMTSQFKWYDGHFKQSAETFVR